MAESSSDSDEGLVGDEEEIPGDASDDDSDSSGSIQEVVLGVNKPRIPWSTQAGKELEIILLRCAVKSKIKSKLFELTKTKTDKEAAKILVAEFSDAVRSQPLFKQYSFCSNRVITDKMNKVVNQVQNDHSGDGWKKSVKKNTSGKEGDLSERDQLVKQILIDMEEAEERRRMRRKAEKRDAKKRKQELDNLSSEIIAASGEGGTKSLPREDNNGSKKLKTIGPGSLRSPSPAGNAVASNLNSAEKTEQRERTKPISVDDQFALFLMNRMQAPGTQALQTTDSASTAQIAQVQLREELGRLTMEDVFALSKIADIGQKEILSEMTTDILVDMFFDMPPEKRGNTLAFAAILRELDPGIKPMAAQLLSSFVSSTYRNLKL
jgi:hypothetical protein